MDDTDFLAGIRAAPDDARPRLAYAETLRSRGDARGELIQLDTRDLVASLTMIHEIDRLLDLASQYGFPKLPDDPCAGIFPWAGGGSHPTQYFHEHDGHHYYLRWRWGFSMDIDEVTVFDGDLDTLAENEWTFCETNVILAIVSAAILNRQRLSAIVFPDAAGIRAHPSFRPGRSPLYGFPDGLYDPERRLELRDRPRWYQLWERRQRLVGIEPAGSTRELRCKCGVESMTCGVQGCDIS